jgi:hypothetical protein
LREGGYRGKIISFEPLADPFEELSRRAEADPLCWLAWLALSDDDGLREINLAEHSTGSSFLQPTAEMQVLHGAEGVLGRIEAVELELSFSPLYEGQASSSELITWLGSRGFELQVIMPELLDRHSAYPLQADAIFARPGQSS